MVHKGLVHSGTRTISSAYFNFFSYVASVFTVRLEQQEDAKNNVDM
jgi:hypothetical protein